MSRSLRDCLAEYPRIMLEAIAEGWRIALTDEQVPEIVERLVVEMTDAQAVESVCRRLSDMEREALAFVAASGQAKAHALKRRYGGLRHFGPGRLEWQQAWRQPASAVERLWFLGLLYMDYGTHESFHGQVFFIPPEIAAILPPMSVPLPVFHVEPAAQPAIVRDDQDALSRDVFAILSHLRNNVVRTKKGALSARELSRLRPRFRGSLDPARLAFLHHLCEQASLIHREEGLWRPTRQAASWLKKGTLARRRALYHTWLEDNQWNELCLMPGIRCEDTGWRNDPVRARKAILDYLHRCPINSWLTIDSFINSLCEADADFLRPDGDYDSWYIRDAQTGHYLMGFAHWERVEGALIRYLLEQPLFWLGIVAAGNAEEGRPADRFKLTNDGAEILGLVRAKERPSCPVVVQPKPSGHSVQVTVPREASWYDRFLLERFARWMDEQPGLTRYAIDAASVRACLESGVSIDRILAFLRRVTRGQMSAQAQRTLQAWAKERRGSQ